MSFLNTSVCTLKTKWQPNLIAQACHSRYWRDLSQEDSKLGYTDLSQNQTKLKTNTRGTVVWKLLVSPTRANPGETLTHVQSNHGHVGMTPLPVCCLRLCGKVQWATPAGTEGGMEVSGRAWTGAETPSQPFISVVLKARRLLPECKLLTERHMYLQPFLVMYIFGSDVSVMESLHFRVI